MRGGDEVEEVREGGIRLGVGVIVGMEGEMRLGGDGGGEGREEGRERKIVWWSILRD